MRRGQRDRRRQILWASGDQGLEPGFSSKCQRKAIDLGFKMLTLAAVCFKKPLFKEAVSMSYHTRPSPGHYAGLASRVLGP